MVSAEGRVFWTYIEAVDGQFQPFVVNATHESPVTFTWGSSWSAGDPWPDPVAFYAGGGNPLPVATDLAWLVDYNICTLASAWESSYAEGMSYDPRIAGMQFATEVLETAATIVVGSWMAFKLAGKVGYLKAAGKIGFRYTHEFLKTGIGLLEYTGMKTASTGIRKAVEKDCTRWILHEVAEELLLETVFSSLASVAMNNPVVQSWGWVQGIQANPVLARLWAMLPEELGEAGANVAGGFAKSKQASEHEPGAEATVPVITSAEQASDATALVLDAKLDAGASLEKGSKVAEALAKAGTSRRAYAARARFIKRNLVEHVALVSYMDQFGEKTRAAELAMPGVTAEILSGQRGTGVDLENYVASLDSALHDEGIMDGKQRVSFDTSWAKLATGEAVSFAVLRDAGWTAATLFTSPAVAGVHVVDPPVETTSTAGTTSASCCRATSPRGSTCGIIPSRSTRPRLVGTTGRPSRACSAREPAGTMPRGTSSTRR